MAEPRDHYRSFPQEDLREQTDVAALADDSPDAISVHQDGIVVYVNAAGVRLLGAESSAQIVGHPSADFSTAAVVPGIQERVASLTVPGATAIPAQIELRRLDGSTLPVESVVVRAQWAGRPALQTIMRDVTANGVAAAALHHQASLVEHVSDAIIATTRDGVVTSWNPAAETIYGWSPEQAVGQPIKEVIGAALDPAVLLAAGGVTEALHRRADQSTLAIRVSAAEMASGYVLVCTDETARRRAEHNYATVVDALSEGVIVVGRRGAVESVNPAALQILGMTYEQAVGVDAVAWPLYDETGALLPVAARPSVITLRTGEPRDKVVVRCPRRDGGGDVWLALTSRSLTPDHPGPHRVVVSFTDITESRAIRERLERDATRDPLTGLANRTLVLNRLQAALRFARPADVTGALFIDLDKFKIINDSLGHSVGDQVLRVVGQRLRREVRPGDLVGRLGGDEFVIVVTHHQNSPGAIQSLAERLRRCLTEPIDVEGRKLHVEASVGIALASSDDPRTAPDILRDADVAMYQAKTLGRDRVVVFDVQLRERMQRSLLLQEDLREAVHKDQLWMAYQPIVDLRTGKTVAVEGLLRWTHPVHGTVSPDEFIPVAEDSELIHDIGAHMLRMAASEVAAYRARHQLPVRLKVNLSARQLEDPSLRAVVLAALSDAGLPARAVGLEVTESTLMHDPAAAAKVLSDLRQLGFRLAIDDFGTGYSSLAQLQQLPLDTLKIDRSFIARIGENPDAEAIVTSIIVMAHAVGLTVIAEGVETGQQLDILRRLGCDLVQGFHLGRPTRISELAENIAAAETKTSAGWPAPQDHAEA